MLVVLGCYDSNLLRVFCCVFSVLCSAVWLRDEAMLFCSTCTNKRCVASIYFLPALVMLFHFCGCRIPQSMWLPWPPQYPFSDPRGLCFPVHHGCGHSRHELPRCAQRSTRPAERERENTSSTSETLQSAEILLQSTLIERRRQGGPTCLCSCRFPLVCSMIKLYL